MNRDPVGLSPYSQFNTGLPLRALSDGMHALAQPLSVVQGTLELASIRATTLDEYREAVEDSLTAASQAADLLLYMKELIRVCRGEELSVPVTPLPVIENVIEDLRCLFDESAIELSLHCAPDLPDVLGSELRIRQALFYMLQTAGYLAGNPKKVEVSSFVDGDYVCIAIKAPSSGLERPTAGMAGSLRLAEMIVTRDSGKFSLELEPFAGRAWFLIDRSQSELQVRQKGA